MLLDMMTRVEFQNAVEDLFKVPHGSLKNSDSRETIEGWNSFADVDVLSLIEKEFGIEAEGEITEAETFGGLLSFLEAKGAFG